MDIPNVNFVKMSKKKFFKFTKNCKKNFFCKFFKIHKKLQKKNILCTKPLIFFVKKKLGLFPLKNLIRFLDVTLSGQMGGNGGRVKSFFSSQILKKFLS